MKLLAWVFAPTVEESTELFDNAPMLAANAFGQFKLLPEGVPPGGKGWKRAPWLDGTVA